MPAKWLGALLLWTIWPLVRLIKSWILICECGGGFYKVGRWPSACSRDNLSWFQLLEQFGKGVILEWRQNEDKIIYGTLIRPICSLYMNWLTSSSVLSKWLWCCFVQTAPAWAAVMVAGKARMGLLRRVDTATFVTHGAWWLASCCAGPGVLTIQQPGTAGISKGTNRHSLHRLCWCAPWVRGLPSQL